MILTFSTSPNSEKASSTAFCSFWDCLRTACAETPNVEGATVIVERADTSIIFALRSKSIAAKAVVHRIALETSAFSSGWDAVIVAALFAFGAGSPGPPHAKVAVVGL